MKRRTFLATLAAAVAAPFLDRCISAAPQVNGAHQTGPWLDTHGWVPGETIEVGDTFTILGVNPANPIDGRTASVERRFVVTANVSADATGAARLPIYPSIIGRGTYRTVNASPANGAMLTTFRGKTLYAGRVQFQHDRLMPYVKAARAAERASI